jgi:RNA polymerase sigma-70 factor (ECF subfamily)
LRRRPVDQAAWAEFVDRYGPQADAQDVTVLVKLAQKMRSFSYDPAKSFRSWLKTLTHHAWHDFVEGRRRQAASSYSEALEVLHTLEARVAFSQKLVSPRLDCRRPPALHVAIRARMPNSRWTSSSKSSGTGMGNNLLRSGPC